MLQWTGTSSRKGFDVTNFLLTQSWMSNQADEEMALLFFQFVSNLKECHLSEFSWSSYTAQPSFFPGHNSAELSGAWKGISETHVPERLWLARLVESHRNRNLLLVRKDPPHLQQAPIWTLESIAIRPFLHCLQKGEGKNMARHRFILWSVWGANSASQIQNMLIRSLEVLFKSTCCSLEMSEASICYVFWGGDITKTGDVFVYARSSLRLDL